MKITLDSINETLEPIKWRCVSENYTNLDEALHFICDEGHDVYDSWKHIRTKAVCPICKNNNFKHDIDFSLNVNLPQGCILALDQSTKITGYSIFHNRKLITYGIFVAKGEDEAERINQVKEWLWSMINIIQPVMIGIEGIQYQSAVGVTTFQTLARLQGVLINLCLNEKIPYQVCPTNTWRAHCKVTGKSRADKKKSMQLIVKKLFDVSVTDDCADAIGIGKFLSEGYTQQIEITNWE